MMPDPSQDAVIRQYRSGVRAIEAAAAALDDGAWSRPACGEWTATETARHVWTVAGWYHDWLDRSLDGAATVPFDPRDMDRHTAAALANAGDIDGPTAMARFVDAADRYIGRAVDHWDLPYGYPAGVVTTGLHFGIAATEWHLHAWDLSGLTGTRHRPQDPGCLFHAAAGCVAATKPGPQGWAVRLAIPLGRRIKPWETMLRRSGRSPHGND